MLADVRTTGTGAQANDIIVTGDGDDVVFGGLGSDRVNFDEAMVPIGTTSGDDVIVGDDGAATFDTSGGSSVLDTLTTLNAGLGHVQGVGDSIFAGAGNNVVFGGDGDDHIEAGAGADVLLGDNGNADFDTVAGSPVIRFIETVESTEGAGDYLSAGGGNDVVFGGGGADAIGAGADAGRDIVVGDEGNAEFDAAGAVTKVESLESATAGDDLIVVGDGDDVVFGGTGRDYINAYRRGRGSEFVAEAASDSGDDLIVGDNGVANFANGGLLADVTTTGATAQANDTIITGDGDDVVFGGPGSDYVNLDAALEPTGTSSGDDIIVGDDGAATFDTSSGSSVLDTLTTLDAGVGHFEGVGDSIFAGAGNDVVFGGDGDDYIDAAAGADVLLGDNGNADFDTASGSRVIRYLGTVESSEGAGDYLIAGDGSDVVFGGGGSDAIGAGADASRDLVVGDEGYAEFDAAGLVSIVETVLSATAGDDLIVVGDGDDIVFGGSGRDYVNAYRRGRGSELVAEAVGDTGDDLVVGDNGMAEFSSVGGVAVLTHVETTDPAEGAKDTIITEAGDDVVFGGGGTDAITVGTDDGGDLVVEDEGFADFVP